MIRPPRALLDWFDVPRSLAVIAIVGGGYALLVWRVDERGDSPFGLLAAAPVVACVLAPALLALFPAYLRWIHERTWKRWQGAYHAFDDHQIRVVESRGGLWFSSIDVHAALRLDRRVGVLRVMRAAERRDDGDLGEVLSNAGLVRLLGRSTDRTTLRFLAWADRDVRGLWQKKRDASRRSPGTVVPIDPTPPSQSSPRRDGGA